MLDTVGFRESRAPGYAARFEYDAVNLGRGGIVRFSIQGARRDSGVDAESTRGLPDVSAALPAAEVHQRMSLQYLAARRLHGVSLFRPDSAAGAKACRTGVFPPVPRNAANPIGSRRCSATNAGDCARETPSTSSNAKSTAASRVATPMPRRSRLPTLGDGRHLAKEQSRDWQTGRRGLKIGPDKSSITQTSGSQRYGMGVA